jgi:putative tricarboxylic transport membrane protein
MSLIFSSLATLVFDSSLWLLMLAAVAMGMVFGAVPGLGGKLGIVLSIPIVFGMETLPGCVFLVAMHSVVHTGGSIPSILLGIPGTGPDAATVCDGYPMTQRGEGGRALGASLAASAVGGVLGAVFLAALIPVVGPVVLAFGPAEYFFLALLGLTFVGAVSGNDLRKGVLVGALGLMLAFVGSEAQTGVQRFTLGQTFLWDGVDVITAVIGIFAIPECLALVAGQGAEVRRIAASTRYGFGELLEGVKDVGRHWGLTVRTSFIGAVIGLIPGLGGDVASWMCYGHAVQHSKTPERFGKGAVEGVIGPEAANNSKEGGALLPTLFFGIPGSSGMAVMLGALVVLGVQPGPEMAGERLGLVWVLIWTLVIANVLAALLFLAIGRWLALVVHLRAGLLVPFVLLLACVGSFLGGGAWENLPLLVAIGALGTAMKRHHWPRAPFVIGLVLGPIMELSLHQALTIWGPAFVLRPVALALAAATVATIVVSVRAASRRKGADRAAA